MKIVNSTFLRLLQSVYPAIAHCIKITCNGNVVPNSPILNLTDYEAEITFLAATYYPCMSLSTVNLTSTTEPDTFSIYLTAIHNYSATLFQDLSHKALKRIFDNAKVELYMISLDTPVLYHHMLTANVTEITVKDNSIELNCESKKRLFRRKTGKQYLDMCQAILGDNFCQVVLGDYAISGTIETVIDAFSFTDSSISEADGWFDGGQLIFNTGDNTGIVFDIKSYDSVTFKFTLYSEPVYPFVADDTYTATPGCAHTKVVCIDKYDNLVNYHSAGGDLIPPQKRLNNLDVL